MAQTLEAAKPRTMNMDISEVILVRFIKKNTFAAGADERRRRFMLRRNFLPIS